MGGRNRKFTAFKFPRDCPLVLSIKMGWREGRAFETEYSR
jgi:hypothetical protein